MAPLESPQGGPPEANFIPESPPVNPPVRRKEDFRREAARKRMEEQAPVPAPAVEAPPPAADRSVLYERAGTTVWLVRTSEPWISPADGLVIPCAPDGRWGEFGTRFLRKLSALDEAVFSRVNRLLTEAVESRKGAPLTPAEPLDVEVPLDGSEKPLPRRLFLATTSEASRNIPTPEGSLDAVRASVRRAGETGLARLALPLLGGGTSGIPLRESIRSVLAGVLAALPRPGLSEVFLLVQNEEAFEAARKISSLKPQSFQNDLPQGEDLLGIEEEVYAVADALMLRDLEPPIVVGVLGGWGSGKSFVLHLMRERIKEIRAHALTSQQAWGPDPQRRSPYVGHPYLITFDAWTYAKSNLWASLMQTIFRELSAKLTLEQRLAALKVDPLLGGAVWHALTALDDREQKALLQERLAETLREGLQSMSREGELADTLWKRLKEHRRQELQDLDQTNRQLEEARQKLEAKKQELAGRVDAWMEAEAVKSAWVPVLGKAREVLKAASRAANVEAVRDVQEIARHVPSWKRLFASRPFEGIAFLVFAGLSAAVPFFLEQLPIVTKYLGVLLGGGTFLGGLLRGGGHWARMLSEIQADFEKRRSEERARLEKLRASKTEELVHQKRQEAPEAGAEEIPALEARIRMLEAKAESQKARIGPTARFVSLADFIKTRLESDVYAEQLGLMHQVQQDFVELTHALTVGKVDPDEEEKRKIFPRGPARVVVFIEDLDRCPPDKVVEVLEATQLLVKTGLFVVVLAMDVRYVTRALEKRYERILTRRGDPSGLHYIEKIVQIPYRVRPASPDAVEIYLRAQMRLKRSAAAAAGAGGSAGGGSPGGAGAAGPDAGAGAERPRPALLQEVIQFTEEDLERVTRCCRTIGASPRSMKRLVNVLKLLKILWQRPSAHRPPAENVMQAGVLLLAVSSRLPNIMRDVLEKIGVELEAGKDAPLLQMLKDHRPDGTDVLEVPEWNRILETLEKEALLPSELRLREIGAPTFNLIRSFSFVGDIGAEPAEGEAQAAGNGSAPPVPASRRP
jgi:hypothetical protein